MSGRGACAALVLGLLLAGPARAARWDPVDPKDLAATDSTAMPGVDAEILISKHWLEEHGPSTMTASGGYLGECGTSTEDFVRAKIYTRKGVEDQGKFSVDFPDSVSVSRIEARVVKPDGASTELKKSDVFETVVMKIGGDRWKRITFAFPNLVPGDVI